MVAYGATTMAMYFLYRYATSQIVYEFEQLIANLRLRVLAEVANAEVRTIETMSAIQARLASQFDRVSNVSEILVDYVQTAFLLICSSIYVAVLSRPGFLIWCAIYVIIGITFYPKIKHVKSIAAQTNMQEAIYHEKLRQFLRGFKQLKHASQMADELSSELMGEGRLLEQQRAKMSGAAANAVVNVSDLIFIGIGMFLFCPLSFMGARSVVVHQLVTAFLMIVGQSITLAREGPTLLEAGVAYQGILELAQRLSHAEQRQSMTPPTSQTAPDYLQFGTLYLRDVVFDYDHHGDTSLPIGPINLTIRRGELTFITGGNGSGKSTLLKILAGLYVPQQGDILVDGKVLTRPALEQYRSLFSAIFVDQHLFERLYGLTVDEKEVNRLIAMLGLERVTQYRAGRFTNLALSTGQQSRLSMVVALLEDRPVYLLDEWVAHQDPALRRFYYTELLPSLKQRGKTVIAVSHDARYFDQADHLIRLQKGVITRDSDRSTLG